MAKLFYDNLIEPKEIEKKINDIVELSEEKEELWNIIDELIHHRVIDCILENMPQRCHEEFLCKYHDAPYDETMIFYLKKRMGSYIEDQIFMEIENVISEILEEFD